MKFKYIFFTLVLLLGFTFQQCNEEDDMGCDFSGPQFGPGFLDIQGVFWNYTYQSLSENQEFHVLSEIENFYLRLDWDAIVLNQIKYGNTISNPSTLLACSPPPIPGDLGSKDEKITEFRFITLNDFDSTFQKGNDISELFFLDRLEYFSISRQQRASYNDTLDIATLLLSQDTINAPSSGMYFKLKKSPELNDTLIIVTHLKLSTGEEFIDTLKPLIFQ